MDMQNSMEKELGNIYSMTQVNQSVATDEVQLRDESTQWELKPEGSSKASTPNSQAQSPKNHEFRDTLTIENGYRAKGLMSTHMQTDPV